MPLLEGIGALSRYIRIFIKYGKDLYIFSDMRFFSPFYISYAKRRQKLIKTTCSMVKTYFVIGH